ncbi:MAG: sugar ABC transporter permease [Clostridia bacterium]|nr:sugar ABC transporter permease [Clostridia bacterium]
MKLVAKKEKGNEFRQPVLSKSRAAHFWRNVFRNRYLYLLMLPAIVHLVMFEYSAMYGITLAFKDFHAKLGITRSPWIGFKHFEGMFTDPYFRTVLLNTIKISFGRILFEFPMGIIIALCFNEIKSAKLKKTLQTAYTFPHFLSWVIVSGVVLNFLNYNGPVNTIIDALGGERQIFMGNKKLIVPILYITDIWKESGWGSIIYIAAITGINHELYEAADLDGATSFQKIWHVTLPCIRGTILVMLTLRVGSVLNAGFDQIFNMSNSIVQQTIDILDTYIYRITFQQAPDFSYSTAVGLFKSAIGFIMVMIVNRVTQKLEGTGILD